MNFLNELLKKVGKETSPMEKITQRVKELNLEREDKAGDEKQDEEMKED